MKKIAIALCCVGMLACNEPVQETKPQSNEQTVETEKKKNPLDEINDAIKASPNNPDLYIKKAEFFRKRGDVESALKEIDRAIVIDSLKPEFYLIKSDIFFNTKQMGLSMEFAEKALEKESGNVAANLRKAWIYHILNKSDECFTTIKEVLGKDLHNAEAYFLKGLMYKKEGNYKLAVSSFHTATEQDNDYYEAWVQLGLMFAMADNELAVSYYDNAISADSTKPDAHYNKGMYLQEHGEPRKALAEYQSIIRNNPSYYNAYFNSGFVYLELLDVQDSAILFYDKAIGLNPFYHSAYYNRGLAYERNGVFNKALRDYNKALELKPDFGLAAKGKTRVSQQ